MDAAVNTGNSGGAVINTNGTLVGITSAKFKHSRNLEVQGIFFAVPYTLAKQVMDKIIKYGRVIRGYIGFDADPVDRSGRLIRSNHTPVYGMRIARLDPLGPAWQAGFEIDVSVTKIDGNKVINTNHTLELITNTPPNSDITFTVVRAGKLIEITAKVGELQF